MEGPCVQTNKHRIYIETTINYDDISNKMFRLPVCRQPTGKLFFKREEW